MRRGFVVPASLLALACNGEPSGPDDPDPLRFTQISANIVTCGLATGGIAYCWGGLPSVVDMPAVASVTALTVGGDHSCVLSSTSAAFCWGSNAEGALGDGTRNDRPDPVPVAGGLLFTSMVAGTYHTCALGQSGAAYCWGDNSYGQLGDGTRTDRLVPTPVALPPGVVLTSIVPGWGHTCGLTAAGAAWCWGENGYGQVGDGSIITPLSPVAVALPAGVTSWRTVGLGSAHTCGISSAGTLYCWGYGFRGRLGNGSLDNRELPTLVTVPAGLSFTAVGSGYAHTCAITSTGAAWCWGRNAFGEIGDNTTTEQRSPVLVQMPAGVSFTKLTVGFNHSCALDTDGGAWCWGINSSGQLGDGTMTNRQVPVKVGER